MLVELNRPHALNALDTVLRDDLEDLWARTATDPTVRAVVLTGAGRGFCAGADVGDLAGERAPRGPDVDAELAFLPGPALDVPVIVAVNGVCAGGGLHFVADADIAIASDTATFLDPHVSVGQVTALEPVSLALRVPLPRLLRLALLGRAERLDAAAALAANLVTEVVTPGDLLDRALELAEVVAGNSPAAVAASRRALRELDRRLLGPSMVAGWAAVRDHWTHPDSSEGPRAFAQRREPRWALPDTMEEQ
ncbi:enoyl-CoA hydratase [Actinophytocola xinjiangensis]|uniref:Enoyl-CoA hydratase n=1 Tax=Actinophytocola xinjiangensis TaxID=485602 RepID=A0A7Z0WJP7_9PSEU|nr:enoyl-CoA hydratase [Actinophytocola xinjiangensis]